MKALHDRRFNYTINQTAETERPRKAAKPKAKKPKPRFHPRAPKRLKKLWKDYPAHYRIAKYLNVNVAEVWKALMKGKEPVNQDVRTKFGLPRKPRKPRVAHEAKVDKPRLPDYQKWWRGLDTEIRDMYIKETFNEWGNKQP